jgi:hypothetical protein
MCIMKEDAPGFNLSEIKSRKTSTAHLYHQNKKDRSI